MPGYGFNPYGAVPEALRETRGTLRDIMTDYLKNKAVESELKLGLVKADVDRARLDADVARNELLDKRSWAQMEEGQRQFGVTSAQNQARIDEELARGTFEREEKFPHEKLMDEKRLAISRAQLGIAARETTPVKWSTLAQQNGMDVRLLPMLGIDPNGTTTRADAKRIYESYGGYIVPLTMTLMQGDINDLQTRHQAAASPEEKRLLMQQIGQKFQAFEVLNTFANDRIPERDLAKLHTELKEMGSTNKSYGDWAKKYRDSQTKTSAAFADLKQRYERMRLATEHPQAATRLDNANRIIQQYATPEGKAAIEAGQAKEKTLEKQVVFAENWAHSLQNMSQDPRVKKYRRNDITPAAPTTSIAAAPRPEGSVALRYPAARNTLGVQLRDVGRRVLDWYNPGRGGMARAREEDY